MEIASQTNSAKIPVTENEECGVCSSHEGICVRALECIMCVHAFVGCFGVREFE